MAGTKLPWFRLFSKDWLASELLNVSLEAEGAWIRLCCTMRSKGTGTLRCTYSSLVNLLRQRNAARVSMLLLELQREGVGDIALDDAKGEAVITSRRVTRDLEREAKESEKYHRYNEARPPRNHSDTTDVPPANHSETTSRSQKSEVRSQIEEKKLLRPDKSGPRRWPEPVERVVEYYVAQRPKRRPGNAERNAIQNRLKEGFTPEELCEAIDGCLAQPFQNEAGKVFDSLELITRNSAKVNQYRTQAQERARSPIPNENGVVVTIGGRPMQ